MTVRVVRDSRYSDDSERMLLDEFRTVFGDNLTVDIEYLEKLVQTASGKYRFAECRVDMPAR